MSKASLNDPSREFYPIPSEAKQEGWQQFLSIMPDLLSQGLSTRELMPILHTATTQGVRLQDIPQSLTDLAAVSLLVQGRDQQTIDRVIQSVRMGLFSTDDAQAGRVLPNTKCRVDMPRIGHVRQYGERIIDNGPSKIVHAPHKKPFGVDGEIKHYVGLAEGLDEVFTKLCGLFDSLQDQYKGAPLPIKLRIIAYFQMWGASVIHPFFDANGRAFGAKLVFDLNKIGIPYKTMPALGEINSDLADNALALAGEQFLKTFLAKNNLPLLPTDHAENLEYNARYWKMYSERLRTAIIDGIGQGIFPEPDYEPFLSSGAMALGMVLSRDGHWDPSFYRSMAPGLIAQQRALEMAMGRRK